MSHLFDDPLDEVYAERNAVVLAFAVLAARAGWKVGYVKDEAEPGWPVLMIDTPEGQVSWHFWADDMPDHMPPYDGDWDGHDTREKYARLARCVAAQWDAPIPDSRSEGTNP